MGNQQTSLHEPKPLTEQPKRSALSRSRSFRGGSAANSMPDSSSSSRLLNNNNSLLKQTLPYNVQQQHGAFVEAFSSGTGGEQSPQWGWYINTTPPTPDIYSSRPHKTARSSTTCDTSQTSTAATESSTMSSLSTCNPGDRHSQPNPVFQEMQDKNRAAPMGWHPSVPL